MQTQAAQEVATDAAVVEETAPSENKRKLSMDGAEPEAKKVKVKEDQPPQR